MYSYYAVVIANQPFFFRPSFLPLASAADDRFRSESEATIADSVDECSVSDFDGCRG